MHTKKRKLIWKAVWLWGALAFFGLEGKTQGVTEVTLESISKNTYEINSAGDYKITGTSSAEIPTSKNIKIYVEGTVNITIENVNISTDDSNGAPFDIEKGTVNLTLVGSNSLIATGNQKAGLHVAKNTSLTITKESDGGSLTAQGSPGKGGAGIGSNVWETAGSITIDGGTILAKHGDCAAGIGGGYHGSASSITINGGYVTAIRYYADKSLFLASIGGGYLGNGGIIIIAGGTVITLLEKNSEVEKGFIGFSQTPITITGGSAYYNYIISQNTLTDGNGNNLVEKEIAGLPKNAKITGLAGADGYGIKDVSTDENGKLYLWLPESTQDAVSSCSFEGKTYYRRAITLNKDDSPWTDHNKIFTLKKDNAVEKISGTDNVFYLGTGDYTVYADGTSTDQKIKVSEVGDQTVAIDYYTVTYNPNDGTSTTVKTYLSGITISTESEVTPIRNYYTFKGWGNSQTATDKVETITNISAATTLYAIWEANPFTVKTISDQELTYKTEYSYTFVASNISNDITSNAGGIQSITLKDKNVLPAGLTLENNIISGKPINVDETGKEVTFVVTANNGATKEIEVIFKVKKAELTVAPISGQSIYKEEVDDYCPAFTLSGVVDGEVAAYEGKLAWDKDSKEFTLGTLKLIDGNNFSKNNYELKLSNTPVTIKIKDEPVSAEIDATENNDSWYTSDITLSAPTGFQIKGNGKTKSNGWDTELIISEEGSYEYSYSLQRNGQSYVLDKTFAVNLDKTAPSLSVAPNDLEYTLTFSDAGSGIDKVAVNGKDISIAPDASTYKSSSTAGKHTATATDKAGNTAMVEFELKTDVPPYEPPVPPTPSVYYDVMIPSVEGVTTDPVAGSYPVESYGSFSFILTVGEGYRENSQPVVKANGTVVTPRTSDGKYIVRSVTRDTEITIEGIVRDTPTANAEIDNGLYIRQSPHTLHITTPKAIRIRLIDFAGRIIRDTQLSPGENHLYNIATGSYILQPESGEGIKVRVN